MIENLLNRMLKTPTLSVEMRHQRIEEPEKDDDSECDKSGSGKQNINARRSDLLNEEKRIVSPVRKAKKNSAV